LFLGKNGMKKDRKQELDKKTPEQLHDMVRDARNSLAQLQFDLRAGKTANVKDIRVLRKELAVLLTLLHQHG
jgi:ribosomal protein L29